jgi:hypothetical protein
LFGLTKAKHRFDVEEFSMIKLHLLAALFLSTAAVAQTEPSAGANDAPAQGGVWRASDLIGHGVLGPNGESVGEISDVILDRNGQISGYVLSVGGTLGVGERTVAVSSYALRMDPVDTTASTGTVSAGLPASTASGARARADMQISNVLTPDRIILNVPMDQIQSAPQFAR